MYDNGQAVSQDYQEAAAWYRKAAEQGYARAQFNLGVMYRHGQGVRQNAQEAVTWYRKAAQQGHAWAQANLGVMYEVGQGVPQDFVRAHMWYSLAATAASDEEQMISITNRESVTSHMTAAQIVNAQEMARRCQDTKFKECE